MKGVLISIQPKWCQLIADKKKVVEVRKTRPKLETPFKVYIYMTMGNTPKFIFDKNLEKHSIYEVEPATANGRVVGEFICREITEYRAEFTDLKYPDAQNKNVCQNTIKRVEHDEEEGETFYRYETSNEEDNPDNCKFLKDSCLTFNEVRKYIGKTFFDKPFYGWRISDLKIYDKPKELSEFKKAGFMTEEEWLFNLYPNTHCHYDAWAKKFDIDRPPQDWFFVEADK